MNPTHITKTEMQQGGRISFLKIWYNKKKTMEEEEEINLDKPSAYLEFRQVLILFIFFFSCLWKSVFFLFFYTTSTTFTS